MGESFRGLGLNDEEIERYMTVTRGEDDQDESPLPFGVYPANWTAAQVFARSARYQERHPVDGRPLALRDGPVWRCIDRLKNRDPEIDEIELYDKVMLIGDAAAAAIRERFYAAD